MSATPRAPDVPQAPGVRRRAHRRPILIALMVTMGLSAMDNTIVATAIPQVVHDLGGFTLFSWVFSSYLLTQTVTIPICGIFTSRPSRKAQPKPSLPITAPACRTTRSPAMQRCAR